MQEVTLAYDADQPIGGIDDRNAADAPFAKELCHRLHRRVGANGNDFCCHHIHSVHRKTTHRNSGKTSTENA